MECIYNFFDINLINTELIRCQGIRDYNFEYFTGKIMTKTGGHIPLISVIV